MLGVFDKNRGPELTWTRTVELLFEFAAAIWLVDILFRPRSTS